MRTGAYLLVMLALVVPPTTLAQTVPAPTVDYSLAADLNDSTAVVTGDAEIHYQHLANDTLRRLTLFLGHNAFRPGARDWPREKHASEADIGFLRIQDVRVDGAAITLHWPNAPDSTTARIVLPRPLMKSDSVVITFRWQSRPPNLPERRARRGRHIELVNWYPLVLDETSPTPVVFPAIATHTLQLSVASDQVIGGTGEALCGDPGWKGAVATRLVGERGASRAVTEEDCKVAGPGRKTILWYAEGVGQLAYALSPTFRYEEGDFLQKPVHALYEKGQERSWGAGLAIRRTEAALAWTIEIGGRFPWPHVTVVQGLDSEGQAMPMLILAGSSAQSTILHLTGLLISQQMLAGGTPTFTVGTAAFQTTWFFETLGRRGDYARLEREVLDWDLDGLARTDEPVTPYTASPCASTSCRRAEFMAHQLRWWADNDSLVRRLYNTVIDTFLLKPAVEGGFPRFARELITPDPLPLFQQVANGGVLFDDALADIRRERRDDSSWRTRVVVQRRADGLFPQTVWVIADADTAAARATLLARQETLTIVTRTRPKRVVLDPLAQSHDWNMLNNQRTFSGKNWLLLAPHRPIDTYIGGYFLRRSTRDHLTLGIAPTVWYNDAGGWTVGGRARQDYLGRYELNELWASATPEKRKADIDVRLKLRNPVWLRATGWSQGLTLGHFEGRAQAGVEVERQFAAPLADSVRRSAGLSLHWLRVTDTAYVDPRLYDDAGTAEATFTARIGRNKQRAPLRAELQVAAGYAYANDSSAMAGGPYTRLIFTGSTRRSVANRVTFGARWFVGAVVSTDSVPRQRRIFLSSSDPQEQLNSPFLRSRGSILLRRGMNYRQPGGAGVRALDVDLSGSKVAGMTAELELTLLDRAFGSGLLRRIALAGFIDGGVSNGDVSKSNDQMETVADAGAGVRIDHRIGMTAFQTRFDFPVWLTRPSLANASWSREKLAYRWVFSFSPSF